MQNLSVVRAKIPTIQRKLKLKRYWNVQKKKRIRQEKAGDSKQVLELTFSQRFGWYRISQSWPVLVN